MIYDSIFINNIKHNIINPKHKVKSMKIWIGLNKGRLYAKRLQSHTVGTPVDTIELCMYASIAVKVYLSKDFKSCKILRSELLQQKDFWNSGNV